MSRQKTSRRLVDENAEALLLSLQELEQEGKIELYDAYMEDMPRVDQFCLALKTDVSLPCTRNLKGLKIDLGRCTWEWLEPSAVDGHGGCCH